ncbi:uncharacterized protein CMC5_014070 [Chondromyces crocatus]|uniref:Uncharacterized protein n=2 Tax=Chondromyces crocatus TaxID=52 RepID=A0A0K1E8R8_CHOCO|nr:uncharacterized protein CMC5_014070 [Chondromyces crocatus]
MNDDVLTRLLRPSAVVMSLALGTVGLGCATDNSGTTATTTTTTTSGTGGGGGSGGAGGEGGVGGEVYTGPCDRDCSKIDTPLCKKAVCNEGQLNGPVGFCIVVDDDGASCDDGLFCTVNDSCMAGACIGGPQNDCGITPVSCQSIVCDEASKSCVDGPHADTNGNPCTPADLCQTLGACQNGTCVGSPRDCTFSPHTECNVVACNPATGACEPTADTSKNGAACSLTGDLCRVGKTCNNGQCGAGNPKDCSAFTAGCVNGVCNAQNGLCQAEAIAPGGTCIEATDACNVGICSAGGLCEPVPVANGTACNDFNTCTDGDVCMAGTCAGAQVANCTFYMEEGFESCPPSGWTLSGPWECGVPTTVGPSGAFEGSNVIATRISANHTTSQTYAVAYAQTPPINLSTATNPMLRFMAWVSTHGRTNVGFNLKVSTDGGTTWTVVNTVSPRYPLAAVDTQPAWGGLDMTNGTYQPFVADLSAYVGQTVLLRFSFRSDTSTVQPGVYVDNVIVAEADTVPIDILRDHLPRGVIGQPYHALMAKRGGSTASVWSIVSGTNHAWLTIDPATGTLSGAPTAAEAGPFSITLRVSEPTRPSNFTEKTLNSDVFSPIYAQSFEGACPAGWTLSGDWECGVPVNVGPMTAFQGTQCIATKLATEYSNSQAWTTTNATSPSISLVGATNPQLSFFMWVETEGSTYDGANLKISTNNATYAVQTNVTPAYNLTSVNSEQAWGGFQSGRGWQKVTANLSAFVGQSINVRMSFRTDGSIVFRGVYVDDLIIVDMP